jgi:SAM-dependent methyltransferase
VDWLRLVQCPVCAGAIEPRDGAWRCDRCGERYGSAGRPPDFLPLCAGTLEVEEDYEHDPGRNRGRLRRLYNGLRRRFELSLVAGERDRLGRAVDLVDVGSGDPTDGGYPSRLRPLTRVYLGIDPSMPLGVGARASERVALVRAAGELRVLRPEAADVALCFSALDHCVDPGRVLANMFAALRPGGLVIVDLKNAAAWYRRAYERAPRAVRRLVRHDHPHRFTFTPASLAAALRAAGFREVVCRDFFYVAPWLESPRLDWIRRLLGEARSAALLGRVDAVGRRLLPGRGGLVVAVGRK